MVNKTSSSTTKLIDNNAEASRVYRNTLWCIFLIQILHESMTTDKLLAAMQSDNAEIKSVIWCRKLVFELKKSVFYKYDPK